MFSLKYFKRVELITNGAFSGFSTRNQDSMQHQRGRLYWWAHWSPTLPFNVAFYGTLCRRVELHMGLIKHNNSSEINLKRYLCPYLLPAKLYCVTGSAHIPPHHESCWPWDLAGPWDFELFKKPKTQFEYRSNGPSITCESVAGVVCSTTCCFSVSHSFGSSQQAEKLEVSLAPPAIF